MKAGQKETEVKSLEVRLRASEQSAEIMQSLSSPQVMYLPPLIRGVHSLPCVQVSLTVTKVKHPAKSVYRSPPPVIDLESVDFDPPSTRQPASRLTSSDRLSKVSVHLL